MTRRLRILIVDDERIVCERLSAELERTGFLVEAFTDSHAALQRVATQCFDLVITDLKMPGTSGLDVLSYIRQNCPQTRVIVITGFATEETARQAIEDGAVDFIPKPFKMSQLRELVQRMAAEPTPQDT